jgi:hypothetical protein
MACPTFFLFRGFTWGFGTNPSFTGWSCQPHGQSPTWSTRVSLFVWVITFDLSGIGAPACSYATAGIALRILWPHKPRHFVKVEIPSAGTINMFVFFASSIMPTVPKFLHVRTMLSYRKFLIILFL